MDRNYFREGISRGQSPICGTSVTFQTDGVAISVDFVRDMTTALPLAEIALAVLILERPTHRSERAQFRHSAPHLLFDGEACVGPRMKDADWG